MRLAFRIDLIAVTPRAALCVALVCSALPFTVQAQTFVSARAFDTYAAPFVLANAPFVTAAAFDAPATIVAALDDTSAESGSTLAAVLRDRTDAASMNDLALDDQMLSHQRGGASGMLMVAATPQLMRGGTVTLWDEIAPPAPLPVPVDAARTAQTNVTSYTRK
ncbi:hypothetical protein BWP39_04720 [Paraburkholderia acidicola]|uniref:Uncharacterized protein n=1 Tax=Paraburkholderia acidicola TaxID=1912599 RepID=A0A2A4F5H0_9BURK|nr:hypothetical protein [Paraburkholderia acidicola]PCE27814.1 hypothetical protein BWP39_04720 [Paraburkholderia acidicola]